MTINNSVANLTLDIAQCYQYYSLGALSVVLIVCSLPANSILVWTVYRNKNLHTPINYLIASLAITNIIGTLAQFPLIAINAFSCRFVYGETVCSYMAFSIYFYAIMNICILVIVSIERYLVICQPLKRDYIKKNRFLFAIGLSVLISTFWSAMPMTGWSRYVRDGIGLSCIIDFDVNNAGVLSFGLSISGCCYLVPLLIFIYTNRAIIITVKNSTNNFAMQTSNRKKLRKENYIVKITIVLIAAFFISYTPVFITVLLAIINLSDLTSMPPIFLTAAFMFARSTLIWPSFFYMFMNKDIRANLVCFARCNQVSSNSTATASTKPSNSTNNSLHHTHTIKK